ncbi:MAG: class I SAM-dependent methyltransferase [Methylococcales bacterium]|nr:class I SAM-dependent methyltransferase [Methylococcales bacterium]
MSQQLAEKLALPLYLSTSEIKEEHFFLSYREERLVLLDKAQLKKGGLSVNINARPGEKRSYPAPRQNDLAKALGRKTKTIIDATTGWGQDALFMFRMGYQVQCFERSPMMAALLDDAFLRLEKLEWMQKLQLNSPKLTQGDAIKLLTTLDNAPDCIYLDPMFPPKRKKSALAKKSMQLLHTLLGQDEDKDKLFVAAMAATAKRVVIKSPDYAEPLGGKPTESFKGKLLRYDVYLK